MDDLGSQRRERDCLLIGLGEVGTVHSLPAQLRAKWAAAAEHQLPDRSLGGLQARLDAADANRQSFLSSRTRFPKRPRSPAANDASPNDRVQEIEARLASAEASRLSALEARRAKAARNLRKVLEAMARVSEQKRDKAAQIEQSLAAAAERRSAFLQLDSTRMATMHAAAAARRAGIDAEWQRAAAAMTQRVEQAAAARQAQLAAAAARMAEQGAQAKARSRLVRASKQARLQAKAAALQQRQERASQARHEMVQAFVHSLPHAGGGSWQLRSGKDLKRLQRQVSSRKLQKFWKSFRTTRSTTAQLAQAFLDTGIPTAQGMSREASLDMDDDAAPAVAVMGPRTGLISPDGKADKPRDSFERFAAAMQAPASLRAAQALLRRLSAKWTATIGSTSPDASPVDVPALLRHLRISPKNPATERYPTRVFMCAYMVLRHPEVVFSQMGDRERSLASAAGHMIAGFEAVLHRVLEVQQGLRPASAASTAVSMEQSEGGLSSLMSEASTGPEATFSLLLAAWDQGWGFYLEQFAAWKSTDAANLEGELVRMATELETSLLAKTGREGAASPVVAASDDLQAMVEQMQRDHALLRARIQRLGGQAGLARLEAALAAVRANAPATPPSPPRLSPRGTPPRTPTAAPASSQSSQQRDPNEALAWELLYDFAWRMPTTELDAVWDDATGATDVMTESAEPSEDQEPQEKIQAVQSRIRRIAERALWDRLAEDLAQQMTQGGSQAAEMLASLFAQVAGELAEAMPPNARQLTQRLEAFLQVADVTQALTGPQAAGSLDLAAVLQHLHLLSQVVQAGGAPARTQPAQAAQEALQAQLGPAQAARDLPALARGLVKAVALLRAQAKFLRMDVANSRLAMLAHSMKDGAGLRYARQKFLAAEGLAQDAAPGQLAEQLPRTRAFLAAASGKLPTLEAALPAGTTTSTSSQPSMVPSELRTGLRATGPARSAAEQGSKQPAARLELGVPLRSWRGLVRAGLADMMTQAASSGTGEVPETLALDAARLHAAQNGFQLLMVQATCLLLLAQMQGGRPLANAQGVKARIAVLLADPSSKLADIAAELARLAAAEAPAAAPSAATLESALQKMLAQQGPGLKVLKASLSQALLACLLSGPEANVGPLLGRVGAGALHKEVVELAQGLGQIAAIGEAVHGPLYDALSADLL